MGVHLSFESDETLPAIGNGVLEFHIHEKPLGCGCDLVRIFTVEDDTDGVVLSRVVRAFEAYQRVAHRGNE